MDVNMRNCMAYLVKPPRDLFLVIVRLTVMVVGLALDCLGAQQVRGASPDGQ